MGNCFSAPTQDDISLLRGSESIETSETSNVGPPPPYQVLSLISCITLSLFTCTRLLHVKVHYLTGAATSQLVTHASHHTANSSVTSETGSALRNSAQHGQRN